MYEMSRKCVQCIQALGNVWNEKLLKCQKSNNRQQMHNVYIIFFCTYIVERACATDFAHRCEGLWTCRGLGMKCKLVSYVWVVYGPRKVIRQGPASRVANMCLGVYSSWDGGFYSCGICSGVSRRSWWYFWICNCSSISMPFLLLVMSSSPCEQRKTHGYAGAITDPKIPPWKLAHTWAKPTRI
jgi:hypothetical protein